MFFQQHKIMITLEVKRHETVLKMSLFCKNYHHKIILTSSSLLLRSSIQSDHNSVSVRLGYSGCIITAHYVT